MSHGVSTTLLYGVFASEKRYLVGLRSHIKHKYVKMLATKAIGNRLPQELIDLVIEELDSLELQTVQQQWRQNVSPQENFEKFNLSSPTAWERRAMEDVASITVDTTRVYNSKPNSNLSPSDSASNVYYAHLSAVKTRPRLALNLPPSRRGLVPGQIINYDTSEGYDVVVSLGPDSQASQLITDHMHHESQGNKAVGNEIQIARLLSCDGVKDAIRDWDSDALKAFVEMLGLKVVPFEEGDALEPGLHVWQRTYRPVT